MSRPNILYLHSHDTGRYIQPYGYAVHTPHLQSFAEQAVVFRNAFNGGPTCSPSRACLLTGMDAHSNGMLGLAHRGFGLNDYGQHLVTTLKRAGYHTALSGIQHVASRVQDIGYDQVLASHATAEKGACSFLDSPPTQPFFLSVGFFETHREYPEPGPGDDPRYCRAPEPLPDTPETRADMAGFHTSVRTLDRKMGLVLEALERNGLAESTLVICTTDHGIAFPRMKCNLTDPGIGVMLMVRGPGGFEGGRVCDALVSQVDVFPTLCDLIGIPRPDWLQGVSLLPLVRGECAEVRDEIRSEVNYHASYEPQRCVRTRRFKYIRRFGDRARGLVRPNCDDSPSKSLWLDNGWYGRTQDTEQLYDLVLDPNEAHNLVADQDRAEVLADMRARLQRWMHETRDPLLDGRVVSAPAGARVNPADGLSPHEPLVDA